MEGGDRGATGVCCHAVQGAHDVVELGDENINEKAIRSSFARGRHCDKVSHFDAGLGKRVR